MLIIKGIDSIKDNFQDTVITIGNFDGVHLGHQALFKAAIEKAKSINAASLAMTFEPHPISFLTGRRPPLITIYEQKIELIASLGIDIVIVEPFTLKFANLSPEEFIKDILKDKIKMKAIVVGKDYTFGKDRKGDIQLLESMALKLGALKLGFEIVTVDWIQAVSNQRISSTNIRELIMAGDVQNAEKLLGRYYQIKGTVQTGRGRGGKIVGFPTVNIKLQDELCPAAGVYAVRVKIKEIEYKGVANIGYSPTFGDEELRIEVHILDFNENIYGTEIRVNFIHRIRKEIKFTSSLELSDQIEKDILTAKRLLS